MVAEHRAAASPCCSAERQATLASVVVPGLRKLRGFAWSFRSSSHPSVRLPARPLPRPLTPSSTCQPTNQSARGERTALMSCIVRRQTNDANESLRPKDEGTWTWSILRQRCKAAQELIGTRPRGGRGATGDRQRVVGRATELSRGAGEGRRATGSGWPDGRGNSQAARSLPPIDYTTNKFVDGRT